MSGGPVFLAGLADTGKTPLRLMLDDHPNLAMVRGTRLWERFDGRFGDLGEEANRERLLAALVADDAVARLHPDPRAVRRAVVANGASYATVFGAVLGHHARQRGKSRWGEQFGGADVAAPHLYAQVPDARVVHLVRDPQALCRVVSRRDGHRPGTVGRTTARWLRSAELARDHARRFAGRYLVVRYESLRDDTEVTLRTVCAFLEEPFADAMLATRARGGLSKPEAGITPTQMRFVAHFTAQLLDDLGYPPPAAVRRAPLAWTPGWTADRVALAAGRRHAVVARQEG